MLLQILFHPKPKHGLVFQEQLQFVAHMHFTHPLRGTREDIVTFFQGDEMGDVGDDTVEAENHVPTLTALHPSVIQFHAEADVAWVIQLADLLEFANWR